MGEGECSYCGSLQPCRPCPSCPDGNLFAHFCAITNVVAPERGEGSEGKEVCYPCADRLGLKFRNCVSCGQPGGATEDAENFQICKAVLCDARIHTKCVPVTGKCPTHNELADPDGKEVAVVDPDEPVIVEHPSEKPADMGDLQAGESAVESVEMLDDDVLILENPSEKPADMGDLQAGDSAEESVEMSDEESEKQRKRNRLAEPFSSAPPAKKNNPGSSAAVDVKCDYVWCKCTLQKDYPCAGCNSDKRYHLPCALIRYEQQPQRNAKTYDVIFPGARKEPGFPIVCVECAVKYKLPRRDLVPVHPGPHDTKWEIEGPAFSPSNCSSSPCRSIIALTTTLQDAARLLLRPPRTAGVRYTQLFCVSNHD
jgi:hypothetical protein